MNLIIWSQPNITVGNNSYNFQVTFTEGSSSYAFEVYRNSCSSQECTNTSALTSYSYYAEDDGDGSGHAFPSDTRYCEDNSFYDSCDDLSASYYIKVYRDDGLTDCTHYTLSISNGYQ